MQAVDALDAVRVLIVRLSMARASTGTSTREKVPPLLSSRETMSSAAIKDELDGNDERKSVWNSIRINGWRAHLLRRWPARDPWRGRLADAQPYDHPRHSMSLTPTSRPLRSPPRCLVVPPRPPISVAPAPHPNHIASHPERASSSEQLSSVRDARTTKGLDRVSA